MNCKQSINGRQSSAVPQRAKRQSAYNHSFRQHQHLSQIQANSAIPQRATTQSAYNHSFRQHQHLSHQHLSQIQANRSYQLPTASPVKVRKKWKWAICCIIVSFVLASIGVLLGYLLNVSSIVKAEPDKVVEIRRIQLETDAMFELLLSYNLITPEITQEMKLVYKKLANTPKPRYGVDIYKVMLDRTGMRAVHNKLLKLVEAHGLYGEYLKKHPDKCYKEAKKGFDQHLRGQMKSGLPGEQRV